MQHNIWISKGLCWVKETRYRSLHDSIHMAFCKTQYYTVSMQLDHWLPGAEWDEGELSTKGYKETFWGDGNILNLPCGAETWLFGKSHWTI